MLGVQEKLLAEIASRGFEARVVAIDHLCELAAEIEGLHTAGMVDQQLSEIMLRFRFDYSEQLPDAMSVVVVAMPEPIVKLQLSWQGKQQEAIIPPTYCSHHGETIREAIQSVLEPAGYQLVRPRLPLKLLSVRSGLSMYGRNNITYTKKWGSYYQLTAYLTNMPCENDSWQPAQRMTACDSCNACVHACPTKCIDPHRPVIRAERCLTYFSELDGDFPDWLERDWHNSLVGCMRCQSACPQNSGRANVVEITDVFTEDELGLILSGVELGSLPQQTRDTLVSLQLADAHQQKILPRNLAVLLR